MCIAGFYIKFTHKPLLLHSSNMAENTKMEVDGNASETIDENETEENMDEGVGEESDSSDSDASDGNEAVHDPKVQQLELQVLHAFLRLFLTLCARTCEQLSEFDKLQSNYSCSNVS